ncbi:MAG TPA: 16S rRNA (guanine(527)-N(7))-methyltransferase RsmG, partial [Pseudomonas sp.]|nr:16S rRNA (guanine(527)-N(7))-methyltransferase RsmG [Pseudomonas sp.]
MSEAVTRSHAEELVAGSHELGIALSEQQQRQLLDYLALLIKWNKAYNL